jgi:radical SAM superfamily enzyme YgiQ (UPF0313 family)
MFKVALIDMFNGGNYGIRCLNAVLQQQGFEVYSIYSYNDIQDIQRISENRFRPLDSLIRDLQPDLIGFSIISTFCFPYAAEMAKRIKSFSHAPIIFGGAHPSLAPELTLKQSVADYVCIGEAEDSFTEFCRTLSQGREPDSIPGIMSKKKLTYQRRDPPAEIDALPFQTIEDSNTFFIFDDSVAKQDVRTKGDKFITRCSRGCPFRCSYCGNEKLRHLYAPGKYLRRRSVENIIEEIRQHLKRNQNCKRIWFIDDSFPSAHSWVKDFCEQYGKHVNLPFEIWVNPNTIKEQNIELLRSAGLQKAIVGIESASDITRKEVFLRTETRDAILNADGILSRHGISKHYDIIIDHPWESETELQETCELFTDLQRPFTLNMHSCILLPGTRLAERAIQEGLVKDEEEIIRNVTSDSFAVSRKFQWIRGVPTQKDHMREFWIYLILHTDRISKRFLRILLNHRVFQTKVVAKLLLFTLKTWFLRKDAGDMKICPASREALKT